MLSSTVIAKEVSSSYPKMLKDGRNITVLFTKHGIGVVISSFSPKYPIGYNKAYWDMEQFTTEVKSVTITSK